MTVNGIAHFDVFGPDTEALHAVLHGRVRLGDRRPGTRATRSSARPRARPTARSWRRRARRSPSASSSPDLAAAIAAAEAAGGSVVMPPTDNGWVVKAQVADPAGNRVSLIAA